MGKIMKTNVQQTSVEAYHSHEHKATQMERIARWMLYHHTPQGHTIGEVAAGLKMEKSTVSARMNALKKMDPVYLDLAEYDMLKTCSRKCRVSSITCQAWVLAPRGVQLQLFN